MIKIENIILELKKCKRKFKNFIKKYNKSNHVKGAEENIKEIDRTIINMSSAKIDCEQLQREIRGKFRFKSRKIKKSTRKIKKKSRKF